MNKTKIPWADYTWNPVTGCTPISEGCQNCYSQRILKRFKKPSKVILYPERLDEPLKLKKPSKIFVCSMSDLFHEDVPQDFILDIIGKMICAEQHTFLILTKRAKRMAYIFSNLNYPLILGNNIWLGVTCETQKAADERIPLLLQTPAEIKCISCEPLLGPIDLTHMQEKNEKLDWVIVGGETGPGARECREEWVQSIYDQCKAANVSFFFKARGNNWKCNTECSGFRETTGNDCRNYCGFYIEWESRRAWPE